MALFLIAAIGFNVNIVGTCKRKSRFYDSRD
jgi:hypothetical protein